MVIMIFVVNSKFSKIKIMRILQLQRYIFICLYANKNIFLFPIGSIMQFI